MHRLTHRICLLVLFFSTAAFGQSITISTDHPDGVYALNETIHWHIQWTGPNRRR